MVLQLEQIRNQQKESWNKFSGGCKKWDGIVMDFLKPMGDEIIRLIKPQKNDVILDCVGHQRTGINNCGCAGQRKSYLDLPC